MSKLYVWHSKALEQFGLGTIVAPGATVDEARQAVLSQVVAFATRRWDYLEPEDLSPRIDQLRQDVAGTPQETLVCFLDGSE